MLQSNITQLFCSFRRTAAKTGGV